MSCGHELTHTNRQHFEAVEEGGAWCGECDAVREHLGTLSPGPVAEFIGYTWDLLENYRADMGGGAPDARDHAEFARFRDAMLAAIEPKEVL